MDLESLTLDVYVQHGQVLSLWKSATHDSLARHNSLDISPSVKQGDWILLKRRTCERNVNTHLMGPIIQIRFKSHSYRNHLRAIWRSGSYLTWYGMHRGLTMLYRRTKSKRETCDRLHLVPSTHANWSRMWWRINKNKDANHATMVLKVKKEAIDSHGLQMTLVASAEYMAPLWWEGGVIGKSNGVI